MILKLENLILPILIKDLNYIVDNIEKTSFDLWEEINGWHFYTRMVQLKFLKDALKHKKLIVKLCDFVKIMDSYVKLTSSVKDHICDNHIISSFDKDGKIVKYHDAANLLAYTYRLKRNIRNSPIRISKMNMVQLTKSFNEKYKHDNLNLIGRYPNDKYYNGHIWIICSLALAQIYLEMYRSKNIVKYSSPMHRSKSNPNNSYIEIANGILERILTLDPNLILPYSLTYHNEYFSAKINMELFLNYTIFIIY